MRAMIPRNRPDVQPPGWQQALADAIRDPAELLRLLDLPEHLLPGAQAACKDFPLKVPRGYAALMRRGELHDPLLRQVLPLAEESEVVDGYLLDPVADSQSICSQGLLQKYPGRALLLTTGACAIHCRYCFRRHFPYQEHQGFGHRWHASLAQLRRSATAELILSGGDPLSLSNARLSELAELFSTLPALRRIRFHSRYPVVLPERIDDEFVQLAEHLPGRPIMVIHCNHPQELGRAAQDALEKLHRAGWVLYNQSVLLRGVNDHLETLSELSERLFDLAVQPYYLHQLDRVQGAAHFAVSDAQARDLHRQLRQTLPGYLVPQLVREIPGEASKTPL